MTRGTHSQKKRTLEQVRYIIIYTAANKDLRRKTCSRLPTKVHITGLTGEGNRKRHFSMLPTMTSKKNVNSQRHM
jgi:hypothetical protein